MRHQRAQEFLGRLPELRNELPFSPELLRRLSEQTRADSQSSLDAVAETLSADQGLATKVLVMANSAFYGLQAEVASVSRAVAVLGLREVRNIVLALGIKGLCATHALPPEFDLKHYWTHQVTVSLLAAELARRHGGVPDMLFTAGLLHDVGKLVLALQFPDDWREIHRASDASTIIWADDMWDNDRWMDQALEALGPDVYLTFDVDYFDPKYLPATGTPEPGGGDWYRTLKFLKRVYQERNVVAADVVELAPAPGNHAPDFLVAKLVYKLISYRFQERLAK